MKGPDSGRLALNCPGRNMNPARVYTGRIVNINVIRALGGVPFLPGRDDGILRGSVTLRCGRPWNFDVTGIGGPECAPPLKSVSVLAVIDVCRIPSTSI